MKKSGIWNKIKAYKLQTQIWIAALMFVIFLISLGAYQIPDLRKNEIIGNILLALFTSLLVTVFTMLADIIVNYQSHKNEEYLEDLQEFGIQNLFRDKYEALKALLGDCDRIIWISGYRLILTCKLKQEIYDAIKRGADVKAVICPPWETAFRLVYGDNEKVMDNYLQVFEAMNRARKEVGKTEEHLQVMFVNKPIFSDTYRVDQNLVTGPYMHNKDEKYHRLMAKDFFSYNIVRRSSLYQIVNDEFETLFHESIWKLDWTQFEQIYQKIEEGDMREAEKIEALKSACVKCLE